MLLTITWIGQHQLPNTKDVGDLVAIERLWNEMCSLHELGVVPSCQVTGGQFDMMHPVILHHIICDVFFDYLSLTFQDSQVFVEITKDSSYPSLEFLAGTVWVLICKFLRPEKD